MAQGPVLVVLAAGKGSRFRALDGRLAGASKHKLSQPFGGSTVLGTTLSNTVRSRLPTVVVTTQALMGEVTSWIASRDVVLLPEIDDPQARPLGGMGRSIATGVSARPHARGWLVLPADMPLVRPATLRAVAAALTQHPVAYAQYHGRRGHPVGFAAELYSELVQLDGDEGARRLIARYPAFGVELADPGVLEDVDTLQDLERLRAVDAANSGVAAG